MRKIIFVCIALLVIFFIFKLLYVKYDFRYYESPKSNLVATRVIRSNYFKYDVYYTYGRYNKREVPKVYVKPQSVFGLDEGNHFIINWQDSICTIYTCYGNYDKVGLTDNFRFKRIKCNSKDGEWFRMIEDTLNNFHEQSVDLPH